MENLPNQENQDLLNSVNEWKRELLKLNYKSNKNIAIIAGATVSLAAIVATTNLAVGNYVIAAQNVSAAFAMTSMVAGSIQLMKLKKEELEELKNSVSYNANMRLEEKEILKKLKSQLAEYQIRRKMSKGESIGFLLASISSLILFLTTKNPSFFTPSVLTTALSGLVAALNIDQVIKYKGYIEEKEVEISKIEEPEQPKLEGPEKKLLK